MRKFIIILTTLLLPACSQQEEEQAPTPPKTVKVFKVGSSNQSKEHVFSGKVEAAQEVIMSFQLPGEVIERPVEEGQNVEAGQLIAKLDPKEYQLQVDEALATRDQKALALERTEKLLKDKFATKAKYDMQKAQLDVAQAQYDKALKDLEDTVIHAPFSGTVATLHIEEFQAVKANEPVITLHDKGKIDIAFDVPENIVIRINDSNRPKIKVRFDAAPETLYQAFYKKHIDSADDKTQTFRVYVTMDTPQDIKVLPGMTATVFAYPPQKSDSSFYVPVSAVLADTKGNSYVWVVQPNTNIVTKRPVAVGLPNDNQILVKSGLEPNDLIVSNGGNLLADGQKVNPTEKVFGS
ncbi:MAG: efflux RND transporter periplasmic adaptor subunit [Alphaproteobacteria bacterium]